MIDKRELWYKRNQLNDSNIDYIKNVLCYSCGIDVKEIICDGQLTLMLNNKFDTYKVEIVQDKCCLYLLKRNRANNPKCKEYYHLVKEFSDFDCWSSLINYIMRKIDNVVAS